MQASTITFGVVGDSGVVTIDSGWSVSPRVEVWAFSSPFTGAPRNGTMLLRWDASMGGLTTPELPMARPADGNYYLAALAYAQTSSLIQPSPGGGKPLPGCWAKNNNSRNDESSDTQYCSYDLGSFVNFKGSLRCAAGHCVTSDASPADIVPETGWWWNPAEAGRWLLLEQNDGWVFLNFQVFNADGSPTWYLTTGPITADGAFSGALSQYKGGQTLTGPYVLPTVVGSGGNISLKFSESGKGVMTLPDGRQIPIERFRS
jgi:hypothetical protein